MDKLGMAEFVNTFMISDGLLTKIADSASGKLGIFTFLFIVA